MFTELSTRYQPLNAETVSGYVHSRPELREVFHIGEEIESVEVGDGNLNLVFKVWAKNDPSRTVVLKQALPYLRLVGDSWPLPTDRARIEAEALKIEYRLCPQHTPRVYFYDPDMYLTAMQNLNNHIIMRKGLIQGIKYPAFAEHIGLFLARTLAYTSDLVLDFRTKKLEVARFTNPELCKITEDLVFTEPYRKTERNRYHPEIEPQVLALQADDSLRTQVAQMKEKFMTHAQALIHGDLHTGSIMINQTETFAIDPEFAFYGPMGFDVGAVIGNLFLSYASHEVRTKDPETRADFRKYLTDTVIQLWKVFEREFGEVWAEVDLINMPKGYQEDYMLRVLQDSAGMGACKMMRRVIGLAGVEDIRGIEDANDRSIAASLALNIAQALIMNRREIRTIEELVEVATGCRPSYPWKG
ncbi:MAG: S-methyl-5-thioribose kinase [Chloroflexi bacterium]|nr:S-methyl-5-thioribose kinase [Chloroflexota bacterium]MDL1883749.1 S-methyl-5-thioribose kinase [Anaerolineae bacterium CFX8]